MPLRHLTPSRPNQRGIALIASLLAIAAFTVYTNALTMRTIGQRLAVDRLRERQQALDLAQAALNQLIGEFYWHLSVNVYANTYRSDAQRAFAWLDDFGAYLRSTTLTAQPSPAFSGGTKWDPRYLSVVGSALPMAQDAPEALRPHAWFMDVCHQDSVTGLCQLPSAPFDPLGPRLIIAAAEATVGSITKRLDVQYLIEFGASASFRDAYFINNYAWFQASNVSGAHTWIFGSARSNGDMTFQANTTHVFGDLFAAYNTELGDAGLIEGDPQEFDASGQFATGMEAYWAQKTADAPPTRQLNFPGQPAIGGGGSTSPLMLGYGEGWDASYPTYEDTDQHRYPEQDPLPMPYIGDLSYYRNLGVSQSSTLRYWADTNGDGIAEQQTINTVYGNSDPLILDGTVNPIEISGAIVIPGDVIIKGRVTGQGAIYAGRNIHIVGNITYVERNVQSRPLERNRLTGQLRERGTNAAQGWVCADGGYFSTSQTPAADCATTSSSGGSQTTAPPPSGGGGGGGGATVICTEMYRQGVIPAAWFAADSAYANAFIDARGRAGYLRWGRPAAKVLRHSRIMSQVIRPFARAWAQHMAYLMGAAPSDSRLGRWLLRGGLPVCRLLGGRS